MTEKKLIDMIRSVFKQLQDPYYQGRAAELAFYFLMSLVPAAILLGELLNVFSLSMDLVREMVDRYVSADMSGALSQYLSYTPTGTFSLFFLIFSLWAASKAQFSLACISNYAFTGDTLVKGYVRERLRAIRNIVLTLFMIVFSLVIMVYGRMITELLVLYAEKYLHIPFTVSDVWYVLRWPIAIGVYFLIVSSIYYSLPAHRMPYKRFLPGSVVASVGMLISTWVYAYYATVFANFDLLYGSLASVVALLFWFYILGMVLVVGILVNVTWDHAAYEHKRS